MSASPSSASHHTMPGMLWFGYISLILYSFCAMVDILACFGLIAFVTAFFLRRRMRAQGATLGIQHATWQIHTVYISLAISLVAFGILMAILLWVGSNTDPAAVAQYKELTKGGGIPTVEEIKQILGMPGVKAVIAVVIVTHLLFVFWVLKRSIQGILTMRTGVAPCDAGAKSWVALLLAITLPIAVGCILVMLQ